MVADSPGTAASVLARCEALASYSEDPDRLTRSYGSLALRCAQDAVAGWMRTAGMTTRRDAIGNVIGRFEGSDPGARTLVLGSHLDTVRDAGKYDGPLGVLVAIAAVERLRQEDAQLPAAIEVIAFADEEGLRFHSTFLGSRAVAGSLDPEDLDRLDAGGNTLRDAIRAFGGDPDQLASCLWSSDVAGYIEVHIEQGPVLEQADLPVGVVAAIAGQSRIAVGFIGHAGHAGTVPMSLRHDALTAAAEFVLDVEALARETPGLVATVGQMSVAPGASNVIPGDVTLSLDVRHANDPYRTAACRALRDLAARIALSRDVDHTWTDIQSHKSVACDAGIIAVIRRAVAEIGVEAPVMVSGAGHDAIAISTVAPVGMIFVRCAGGISHHPDESVTKADIAVAIDVLEAAIRDGAWAATATR